MRWEREPIFNQGKKLFFLNFFEVALEKNILQGKSDYIKRKKCYSAERFRVRIIEKEQIKGMRSDSKREMN